MAAQTKITITHDVADVAGDLQSKGIAAQNGKLQHVAWLGNLLNRLVGGASNGQLVSVIDNGDGVAASGTVTFSAANTANDTFLINGVTFTAVASGATGNQWNVGTTGATAAANLAAAINGSATALVNLHVTAAAVSNVLTITSVSVSALGNAVTIAKGTDAGAVMTVSGARLASGANATGSVSSSAYKFGE